MQVESDEECDFLAFASADVGAGDATASASCAPPCAAAAAAVLLPDEHAIVTKAGKYAKTSHPCPWLPAVKDRTREHHQQMVRIMNDARIAKLNQRKEQAKTEATLTTRDADEPEQKHSSKTRLCIAACTSLTVSAIAREYDQESYAETVVIIITIIIIIIIIVVLIDRRRRYRCKLNISDSNAYRFFSG